MSETNEERDLSELKEKKMKEVVNHFPWFLTLLIIGCAILEYHANHWLPDTLHRSDNSENRFNIENARGHLKALTDLGPRVAGSHTTEVLSPQLLIRLLKQIKENAPKNVLIEIDEQHPSGHFFIDFLGGINNVRIT